MSAHRTPDLLFEYAGTAEAARPAGDHRRGRRGGPPAGDGGRQDGPAGARRAGRVGGAARAWTRCCRSCRCRPASRSARWRSARPGRSTRPCWRRRSWGTRTRSIRQAVHEYRAKQTRAGARPTRTRGTNRPSGPEPLDAHRHPRRRAARADAGPGRAPARRSASASSTRPPSARPRPSPTTSAASYDDFQALYSFCQGLDVVTYEFENVPVESARWLAERVPVFPPPRRPGSRPGPARREDVLPDARHPDRRRSRPSIRGRDLDAAVARIGLPAVLKTPRFGYDGKGQAVLRTPADVEAAWTTLGGRPLILEGFVPFDRELSILAVRGRTGELAFYPLVENVHRDGILRVSTVAGAGAVATNCRRRPSGSRRGCWRRWTTSACWRSSCSRSATQLLANEMAPRVHNSGHWTIEGAETSQFENHLRAVAGLPLGPTARGRPVGDGQPDRRLAGAGGRAGDPRGPPAPVRQAAAAGPEGRPRHGPGRLGWGAGRAGPTGAGLMADG